MIFLLSKLILQLLSLLLFLLKLLESQLTDLFGVTSPLRKQGLSSFDHSLPILLFAQDFVEIERIVATVHFFDSFFDEFFQKFWDMGQLVFV